MQLAHEVGDPEAGQGDSLDQSPTEVQAVSSSAEAVDRTGEPAERPREVVLKFCEFCGEEFSGTRSICRECRFPKFSKRKIEQRKQQTFSAKPVHNKQSEWTQEERDAFFRRTRGWSIGKGWDK